MQYAMFHSLVGRPACSRLNTLEHTVLSTRLLTPMHVKAHHTAYTAVSLRMKLCVSKHVEDITN